LFFASEASLGPYAWQHKRVQQIRVTDQDALDAKPQRLLLDSGKCSGQDFGHEIVSKPIVWKDTYLQNNDLAMLARSRDVFRNIETDPCLSMNLPKPNATAGGIIQHAARIFEQLVERHKPLTWKFGITHDAAFRWHNRKFGYKYSKDPFDHMIILYAASNPHGPAFLEAALNQRFQSFLFAHNFGVDSNENCLLEILVCVCVGVCGCVTFIV
jgi:hypothetical protein